MQHPGIVVPKIQRSNRSKSNNRLRNYPTADWLGAAIDATAPGFDDSAAHDPLVATRDEHFPDVSREQLVQDLHRIARIATDQSTDPAVGYIVRTSTVGLPETHLAFLFFRVPRAEARSTRDTAASPARGPAPSSYLEAWQTAVVRAYWCHDPHGVSQGHQIGRSYTCEHCTTADSARVISTATPPPGWTPGDPIPEDIA